MSTKETKSLSAGAFMAGVSISIGCTACLSAGGGLAGAALFSIGLILVLVFEQQLFTEFTAGKPTISMVG